MKGFCDGNDDASPSGVADLFDQLMVTPVPWSKDGAEPGVGARRGRPAGIAEGGRLEGIAEEVIRSSMQSDAHSVPSVRSNKMSLPGVRRPGRENRYVR